MCNKLQTRRQIWIAIPGEQRGKTLSMVKNNENDQLSTTTLNINSGLDSFFLFFCHCPHHWLQPTVFCALTLSLFWIYSVFFHEKIGFISGLCYGFKMLSVSQKFVSRMFFLFSFPSLLPSTYSILPFNTLLIWIEVKRLVSWV